MLFRSAIDTRAAHPAAHPTPVAGTAVASTAAHPTLVQAGTDPAPVHPSASAEGTRPTVPPAVPLPDTAASVRKPIAVRAGGRDKGLERCCKKESASRREDGRKRSVPRIELRHGSPSPAIHRCPASHRRRSVRVRCSGSVRIGRTTEAGMTGSGIGKASAAGEAGLVRRFESVALRERAD